MAIKISLKGNNSLRKTHGARVIRHLVAGRVYLGHETLPGDESDGLSESVSDRRGVLGLHRQDAVAAGLSMSRLSASQGLSELDKGIGSKPQRNYPKGLNMDHKVSIRRSPNVKISTEQATTIGKRCATKFLESGGKPGTCTNAIPETVGAVEFVVFVDYHTNRLLTVTITTHEEALKLQYEVTTDPGELQDIAAEAFYKTLPHDGQNRVEKGCQ